MVPELRKIFNENFSQTVYEKFVTDLNTTYRYPVDFRVAETPLFLSEDFTNEISNAANEIAAITQTSDFKDGMINAIPKGLAVPNESEHPLFMQIDFAVCKDDSGKYIPQLIELQGFPSLYCFQQLLTEKTLKYFDIPGNLSPFFNGLDERSYKKLLSDAIVGNSDPENVILLEIDPWNQKTRIDFLCTEQMLGIKTVCISEIIKRENKLFYQLNGREIPIDKIYNRVIYDELKRKEINYNFRFTEELDVKWIGHPNWFFKISKYSLPFIKSKYNPSTYFLNELDEYPADLEQYVLKPLFSFAGLGVEVNVTCQMLDDIKDKENYILQKKINYEPFILTPDEPAKAEIRMMFLWKDKPLLVNNLVRMSKGEMMGVAFNKNKTWVGSSVAFHF